MRHVHRRAVERLLFASVHQCFHCGFVLGRMHKTPRALVSTATWLFALRTSCIRCGSFDVHRRVRDAIDSETWHPLSRLLRLTGAPLHRCPICRMTYRDWRRRRVLPPPPVKADNPVGRGVNA